MNRIRIYLLWVFGLSLTACSVSDTELVLDKDYLHVADVQQYCQGSCTETLDWEGSRVLVKGHVRDVENDSITSDYYENSRFYLLDVRNGMFMEIRVTDNRDAIFGIIFSLGKQDRIHLNGTAASVVVNEGNECRKGVIVELDQVEDIQINL